MRKLFGHNKIKQSKVSKDLTNGGAAFEEHRSSTPIHQQLATYNNSLYAQGPPQSHRKPSNEDEKWEVLSSYNDASSMPLTYPIVLTPSRTSSFNSLPPGASPPLPSPLAPRSPSPLGVSTNGSNAISRDRDLPQLLANPRKKSQPAQSAALGILKALEPPHSDLSKNQLMSSNSEERYSASDHGPGHREKDQDFHEKKEKKGFWSRDRDRDKDREKLSEREKDHVRDKDRKEDDSRAELRRMIGYLTATGSGDWTVVMEVCERASANENNAKEAVRSLRREFKLGEPSTHLSAARLWAIMIQNCSPIFISQSASRKFLETLESLITSSRTSPVVRERLLSVVAGAAAFAHGSRVTKSEISGFLDLWKRVKPLDMPEEGIPFDSKDAVLMDPLRLSQYDSVSTPITAEIIPPNPSPHPPRRRKSPSRNRIIPPEEDMRRLFQECRIGQGNAALLSQALALTRPEELKIKDVIREFYVKCRSSQELIFAQISWASAGAERSRLAKEQEIQHNKTMDLDSSPPPIPDDTQSAWTLEEKLLADLLAANAELMEALKQYDDLERIATERKAEEMSKKETRMSRTHLGQLDDFSQASSRGLSPSSRNSSRSRSYSPSPSLNLSRTNQQFNPSSDPNLPSQMLAPPPAAPHGPRSPASSSSYSKTPPGTPILDSNSEPTSLSADVDNLDFHKENGSATCSSINPVSDIETYARPSAKALGKRKVVEIKAAELVLPNTNQDNPNTDTQSFQEDAIESEGEDTLWHPTPILYVYDAAAERTQQRIRDGHASMVNVVQ